MCSFSSFVLVIFVNNPMHPLCIFCFLLLFSRPQFLLILSQLFLHRSGNLTYPCSCLLPFLDCVARVNASVSIRACALLRIRALVTVHTLASTKSWSFFVACGESEHALVRHCRSRSWHGHDPRDTLHSRFNFRHQLPARSSDASCASCSARKNSM